MHKANTYGSKKITGRFPFAGKDYLNVYNHYVI